MSTRFRALQHRNFQLFFGGQLTSLIGTWMQSTAQLWLVYKLTGSAALLGVFGFANQIPILVLASIGGYVGDRYNRHLGVIWTQTASMVLAFSLAGLTLSGAIRVWELILIAFLDPDITRLLDRMEKRGLITRERQTDDRRVIKTRVTPEGLGILKNLDQPVHEMHQRQFRHMSSAKLKMLGELLDEVIARKLE